MWYVVFFLGDVYEFDGTPLVLIRLAKMIITVGKPEVVHNPSQWVNTNQGSEP